MSWVLVLRRHPCYRSIDLQLLCAGGILTGMAGDCKRVLTGCSRGSKRSSWGAPGFLKLPESLKTESEAAFAAAWSTLEAGSCAVPALSSRRRSAEYSPAMEAVIQSH